MEKITCRRRIGATKENMPVGNQTAKHVIQLKDSVTIAPRPVFGDLGNQKPAAAALLPSKSAAANIVKPKPKLLEQTVTVGLTRRLQPLTIADRPTKLEPAAESSELACNYKGIFNIDLEEDPLLAARYVIDIIKYLKQLEAKYPVQKNYMHAEHLCSKKMRSVLVNWMAEVCHSFRFFKESFYLSVALLDRYLQRKVDVGKSTLQLVGCVCMYVASKYEENLAPDVSDFVYISDDSFDKSEIFCVERDLLTTVGFALGRPTPITFLRRFNKVNQSHPKAHEMAKYFLELLQLEYELCHVPPSMAAAAACCLSLSLFHDASPSRTWSDALTHYSGYQLCEIRWIMFELAQVVVNAPYSEYKHIYRMYSSARNMAISQDRLLNGDRLKMLANSAVIVKSLK